MITSAGGIAQIEGLSLQQDMTAIYKMLGSCPQENLLWGSLTGREHLLYYARLRGLQVRRLMLEPLASIRTDVQACRHKLEHPEAACICRGRQGTSPA